jgi:hypothetical protein
MMGERVTDHNIERVAEYLRALPPAPVAWVQAAQELPLSLTELDDIVARAEADAQFRQALVADLESALAAVGYHPDPPVLEALRRRFSGN